MHTFEFIRPADPAAAIAAAAQAKTAQQGADVRFVAGGTTLIDLMKLNVETPARLLDINRLPLDKIEATAGRRAEDRRHRSQFRSRAPSDGAARLRRAVAGDSQRRIGPASQHGDDCRQSAAANAVRVLPRHGDALQQARAGNGLPRHHRQQPHARHPWHKRTLHCDQPLGHVRGDGGIGGDDPRTRTEGFARDPHSATFIFCREHATSRNGARTRRPHHTRDAAAAHRRKQAGLSEAARSSVV